MTREENGRRENETGRIYICIYVYSEMRGNFRQGIKFRFVSAATSARSSRVKSFLYCFLTAPIVPPIPGICSDPPLFLSSGPSPVGRRHLRFVAGDPREFVTGNAHCRCESRNDGYLVNGKNENASSRGKTLPVDRSLRTIFTYFLQNPQTLPG